MSLFAELKRRNVFRVAIAYIVTSWLVLQVADVILNNIDAPGWVFRVVALLLAIGFPFALILAWAYELTPEGIKLEKQVDRRQSITPLTGRRLDRLIIGVLVVAIGFLFVDRFYLSEVSIAKRETTAAARQSIAVLPFANLSDESDRKLR